MYVFRHQCCRFPVYRALLPTFVASTRQTALGLPEGHLTSTQLNLCLIALATTAMASSSEQWSSDANEAVQISIIRPGPQGIQPVHEFHPKFTYPIFGEEERIFGYKGLEIDLRFAAHDLRPNVFVTYDKKFIPVGETVALNIVETLKPWLPESAFAKEEDFKTLVSEETAARAFRPPGKLVHSYSRKSKTFEIWAGSLLDPVVRQTVDRMQIFISLFIEAGTPINTTDAAWTLDRWTVYFVYEKSEAVAPYSFVGYATTYRFYSLQPAKATTQQTQNIMADFPPSNNVSMKEMPSCLRISQFLILPPYQHAGHGSALYNAIYAELFADPTVRELAVEEPSEEFDILRDINDWRVLEPRFRAAGIAINVTPFSPTDKRRSLRLPTPKLLDVNALKAIRAETKIAKRQFDRQVEMYLLSMVPFSHRAGGGASLTKLLVQKSKVPDPIDKAYYWWRLVLKQRIYKKNRDQLQQLDLEERRPKVEEAARAQEDEYEKLLLAFAALAHKDELQNGNGSAGEPSKSLQDRKRKIIEDDDDDEGDTAGGRSEAKRTKI